MNEWFRHGFLFESRWLRKHCLELIDEEPGSALIGVSALGLPEMKVDIQVIAVIPE